MLDPNTRFLVVDDVDAMRKAVSAQLNLLGHDNVLTASNGVEALRLLSRQPVDVILSDWQMPQMDGLELLRTVRADANLRDKPFILVTAEIDRPHVLEAIEHGVSDLLVKPYTATQLAAHLDKAARWRPAARKPDSNSVGQAPPPPHAQESGEVPRQTLLIVDDTPDNLTLLANLFKDEYRVRIAHNGSKALALCQSDTPPDLVLLDVMMPGMDGFEVARRMREHPSSETVPVIFVTAMSGDDALMTGLELGAVDFVTKPIDPSIMKARVRNFMRYVALHKHLQADYDTLLDMARLREDAEHITRQYLESPLSGIIRLARDMAERSEDGRQGMQARLIEETARRLLDMVDLPSVLFRIEAGHFHLEAQPVAIDSLLRQVVDMARIAFADKRLAITLDSDVGKAAPPAALGETTLCYAIFQNLIGQACEAAPTKGKVYVGLFNEDPLRIVISHTGVTPAQVRAHFFETPHNDGPAEEAGRGNYSARLLTEAQGGCIELSVSETSHTTAITITLPRAEGSTTQTV